VKGRTGIYSSDLAKAINAPIFHVNGDSMEDVAKVFHFAAEYRQTYKHDVVIDLIGYRRYGHNELDQPSFTQPLMYKQIAKHPWVADIYEKQLVEQQVLSEQECKDIKESIRDTLEKSYKDSKDHHFKAEDWSTPQWEQVKTPESIYSKVKDTGIPKDILKQIGIKINTLPSGYEFHKQIVKIYEARLKSI